MQPTILCIFAHPDDEATVGPLLAKRALEGAKVLIVSVTPGQAGATPNTHLEAGAQLGQVRTEELRQACRCLGIGPPIVLQFEDGNMAHRQTVASLVNQLRDLIVEHRPEDVVTFGPEGASGHTDHRILSAAVTEVFQEHGCPARRLYYLAYPHSRLHGLETNHPELAKLKTALLSRLVDDAFLEDGIPCLEGLDAAEAAIGCHKTQWSPALMKAWNRLNRELLDGKVYLRLALARVTR